MALGFQFGRRPSNGLYWLQSWAERLLTQATYLNNLTPTFSRASSAYDPFNRTTVATGVRRQRPLAIVRGQPIWADLIENSRTNLCVRSSDFNNWGTKTDITVTSAAYTPQDGTGTADLITEGVAGTAKALSAAMTITAARVVTAETRFKAGATGSWVQVTVASDTLANGWRTWANISTGAVGSQSAIGTGTVIGTPVLKSLGNGEYLLTSIGKVAAAATAVQIQISSASADASTSRVNNAAYYAWAVQVEMQAASATTGNPSTYIATTTASVTRAADALSVPYVLGQTGTVLALNIPYLWSADQDGVTVWRSWISDDLQNSQARRNASGQAIVVRSDNNTSRSAIENVTFADGVLAQVAMTWVIGSPVAAYVNGALGGTGGANIIGPLDASTLIRIGGNSGGVSSFCGWVALLAWPRVLSAGELLALNAALPVVA